MIGVRAWTRRAYVVLWALLIVWGSQSTPARAQQPDAVQPTEREAPPATSAEAEARDQEARHLFQAGRTAYGDERYADALEHFRRAYARSPRPELLFNIGQSAERLGDHETAVRAFRDYLTALPEAGNREEVEARIATLEAMGAGGAAGSEPVIPLPEPLDRQPRSGLYLRGAIGAGGFSDTFKLDGTRVEFVASGGSLALELAVGASVKPGFAIAGLLALEWAQVKEIRSGSLVVDDARVGVLGMLGVMADWYIKPEGGWHVQGALALARMEVRGEDGTLSEHNPAGGALILGGGYEWTVRGALSIGVLLRLTGAQLKGDDFTHNVLALSLMFSATHF